MEVINFENMDRLVPIMIASRQSGKTNMQLNYLEEMMKKWNREIVNNNPSIKNVIFNDPATIVFWDDGTKTVVKAENEPFDPEKGLAMAIVKKLFGTNESKSNYNDIFKKWIPEEDKTNKKLEERNNTEILTAKQLAKKTGLSVSTVLRDCRRGLHPGAMKVDGKWLIPYSGLVKDNKNEID